MSRFHFFDWIVLVVYFATYLSSISYLALPGKSFASNWNPFVFSLSIPLATYVAVRWFVSYYRTGREVSAYALLEKRFGLWARVYASIFYLLTQLARIGLVQPVSCLHDPGNRDASDLVDRHGSVELA